MKRIIFISTLFITLQFFNPIAKASVGVNGSMQPTGFELTVNPVGVKGKFLYLAKRASGQWIMVDSSELKGLKPVVLKGSLSVPEMLFLLTEDKRNVYPVFLQNDLKVTVDWDIDDMTKSKVTGSPLHDLYLSYQSISASELDVEAIRVLQKKFIRDHSSSFVTPYIIRREMFHDLEFDELKILTAHLDPVVEPSPYTIELRALIEALEEVAIGQPYTDFEMSSPEGQMTKLSDHVGTKLLLVDFWASWCGPCRRENPNLVKLYNDYNAKGFDIVGVSLDVRKEDWLKGIKDDGLVWRHMSDLKGWKNEGSRIYGIVSIPGTVLIDKNGTIIARNLKGEALRNKVQEYLTEN